MTIKFHGGMDYEEREALKSDSWELYRNSERAQDKADAVEEVILAHYERSLEAYRGKHPSFDVYAAHWVCANAGYFEFNDDVTAILETRYPRPKSPRMEKGKTYWTSQHKQRRQR